MDERRDARPIGLARTVEELRWNLADAIVVMAAGEELPLLVPTDLERQRLRDFVSEKAFRRVPHVIVEWRSARRFVPAESLVGVDERSASVLRLAREA